MSQTTQKPNPVPAVCRCGYAWFVRSRRRYVQCPSCMHRMPNPALQEGT